VNLPYDIARCPGKDCPLKETCLRFLDKGEGAYHLVMMVDPPYKDGNCDQYWEASK
jgi:hypothetical protein